MKLISLKLLNYRRFRQEEIIFFDDFSLIFWKNGSWKSSIFDAIWYALFWPISKEFVRVNTDSLKSHFAIDWEPSKVELVFQVWLDTYRIVRVIDVWIKKFQNDFIKETKDVIFCWENKLSIWGNEVTNEVQKIIWFKRDTFLRSVFAKQKDIEVLSWSASERKNLINSILGLDKLEFIIKDLKTNFKNIKYDLDYKIEYKKGIDINALQKKLKEFENISEELQKKLDSYNKKRDDIYKSFEKVKKDFDEYDKKRQDFFMLINNKKLEEKLIIDAEEKIKYIDRKLEEIEKKEVFLNSNLNLYSLEEKTKTDLLNYSQIKERFNQKENIKKELISLNNEKKIIEKQINTDFLDLSDFESKQLFLEQQINEYEKIFLQKKEEISRINQDLDNIKNLWEQLKKELDFINELWPKSSCPTCKRELGEYFPKLFVLLENDLKNKRKEYSEKNNLKKHLEEEIKKIEFDLNTKKQDLKNFMTKLEQYKILKEKLNNILSLIKQKEDRLIQFEDINFDEKILNDLQKKYEDLQKKVSVLNEIKAFINSKEDLINERKERQIFLKNRKIVLSNILTDLSKNDFLEEKYNEIKLKYENFNNDILKIDKEISIISRDLLENSFEKQSLQKEIDDFKNLEKEIKNTKNDLNKINIKIDILTQYIIYLQDILKPKIESIASSYFQILTNNKYTQISLDDEYNIFIDWKTIDIYSWWEKDLANLCLRLSLWQNLNETTLKWTNFLILDEVLASQDRKRQENIVLNLKKLENKFSQILLVSHIEEIKDFATNLIEVYEKNEFESWIRYHY